MARTEAGQLLSIIFHKQQNNVKEAKQQVYGLNKIIHQTKSVPMAAKKK